MEALQFTLTKTQTYNLKPFGRFIIKWRASNKLLQRVGILVVDDIHFNDLEGMPCEGEEDNAIVKYMLKHKTDVLIDEYNSRFYTRIGIGFTEINNIKLRKYKNFLFENGGNDNLETWKAYEEKNNIHF